MNFTWAFPIEDEILLGLDNIHRIGDGHIVDILDVAEISHSFDNMKEAGCPRMEEVLVDGKATVFRVETVPLRSQGALVRTFGVEQQLKGGNLLFKSGVPDNCSQSYCSNGS